MVRTIENEVAFTRREIGKDALDGRVMQAMATVPREQFVPASDRYLAYSNHPVRIGHGQTISQPYIVALMSDLLVPQADHIILEIGTGSGYQAAVLAQLVRHVYSVEIISTLARSAAERLQSLGCNNVTVCNSDGYQGWPEHAPYDGIIVTAAAPHIPAPLLEQLKPGGRLVIPVGMPHCTQELQVVEKGADGSCSSRGVLLVAFVPLTRRERLQ